MTIWHAMKLNIRRRLEFIEFQLAWEGSVGRKKLQDQFSISPQQATNDLNSYLDICPNNMQYNPRRKAYLPSSRFRPQLISGEVNYYFMQLEMLHHGYRQESEIWIGNIPEFDAVLTHTRRIAPQTLKVVLSAIRCNESLRTKYISLSSDDEGFRTLKPHALASDGHRWHMRAFDFDKNRFSDFVLSRVDSPQQTDTPDKTVPKDKEWESSVTMMLEADPTLTAVKKERLEFEYGMDSGCLRVKVRQAMLFYYLRHYGFDPFEIEAGMMKNKSSFHLVISNLEEVEKCLGRRS